MVEIVTEKCNVCTVGVGLEWNAIVGVQLPQGFVNSANRCFKILLNNDAVRDCVASEFENPDFRE